MEPIDASKCLFLEPVAPHFATTERSGVGREVRLGHFLAVILRPYAETLPRKSSALTLSHKLPLTEISPFGRRTVFHMAKGRRESVAQAGKKPQ